MISRRYVFGVVVAALAGCGSSDRWVDTLSGDCTDAQIEELKQSPDMSAQVGVRRWHRGDRRRQVRRRVPLHQAPAHEVRPDAHRRRAGSDRSQGQRRDVERRAAGTRGVEGGEDVDVAQKAERRRRVVEARQIPGRVVDRDPHVLEVRGPERREVTAVRTEREAAADDPDVEQRTLRDDGGRGLEPDRGAERGPGRNCQEQHGTGAQDREELHSSSPP